jgi:MFS family permease
MKLIARSLRERDFRMYFAGQSVSFVGTWVQQVAVSWIAYRLTGSALVLGVVAFAGQIPSLLLAPLGGLLADRCSRRKILIATQLAEMAVAALLAVLSAGNLLSPAILVGASLAVGIAVAIEMPARHAFMTEIVHDIGNVSNAIALNSVAFNAARLLGPAIGGLVLTAYGDEACFVANALSYLPEVYTLLAIRPLASDHGRKAASVRAGGIDYLRRHAAACWLLSTVACTSVAVSPFAMLLPAYAKDILDGDPSVLGLLMGAAGCGALASGLSMAGRRFVQGIESNIVTGCLLAGVAAGLFAWNTHYLLAVALMVFSGWGTVRIVTSSHALLQAIVPDGVRGQIMAFYTMCYGGAVSIASLAVGALTHTLGIQCMFAMSAIIYIAAGLALHGMLPELRKEIYPALAAKGLVAT